MSARSQEFIIPFNSSLTTLGRGGGEPSA